MKNKLNMNQFTWLVILICMVIYLLKLVSSGKISYFIHPKMIKFIYFSIVMLVIMIVIQADVIFSRDYYKIRYGYLLFIFVLLIAFIVDPKGLNADVVSSRGIVGIKSALNRKIDNIKKDNNIYKNVGLKDIVVNDNNYLDTMNDIYEYYDNFIGRKISLEGFVFKEETFNEEQFVIARMSVSCCAADAEVIGFMCKYKQSSELEQNLWIKVTGTINSTVIEDKGKKRRIPVIEVDKLESIKEPINKYIYQ